MSLQANGDDAEAAKRYGKLILLKVFPVLGVQFSYSATPMEKKFDQFQLQDWGVRENFCEWALSALAVESGKDYVGAVKHQQAYTAVAIWWAGGAHVYHWQIIIYDDYQII